MPDIVAMGEPLPAFNEAEGDGLFRFGHSVPPEPAEADHLVIALRIRRVEDPFGA